MTEILAGEFTVDIDGETVRYKAGDVLIIPPDTEFDLNVAELVDYCCTYH